MIARAAMLFGCYFEQSVAALVRHEACGSLFEQWARCKELKLVYHGNDSRC
jgi:hypothetical protein